MDKRFIISEILKVVTAQYDHALEVVASSDQLIKSGDLKAESKWDTRAIEAGYLASAQKKRLKELEMELISLKNLEKNIKNEMYMAMNYPTAFEDKHRTLPDCVLKTTYNKLY